MSRNFLNSYPKDGNGTWIGLRLNKLEPLKVVSEAKVTLNGLEGDHFTRSNTSHLSGKRALTLIQYEHLPVIAALCGLDNVSPEDLRRNLVVSGINLTPLRNCKINVGEVIMEITGPCAPCRRMETVLGPGGFNAMRGHGGWTARVIKEGSINIGDTIHLPRNQS